MLRLIFVLTVSWTPLTATGSEFEKFERCDGVVLHDNSMLEKNRYAGVSAFTILNKQDQAFTFFEIYREGGIPVSYGYLKDSFSIDWDNDLRINWFDLDPGGEIYQYRDAFFEEHNKVSWFEPDDPVCDNLTS